MCLTQDIKYYSSSESIDDPNNNLEWPLGQITGSKLVIGCKYCSYPISFEEHVLEELRNENNIAFGIVIPIKKLFSKTTIYCNNPLQQWKTQVFCPNCGLSLSFLSPRQNNLSETNFAKVSHYTGHDEQIVMLWTYSIFRGSSEEAYQRFTQIIDQ